MKRTERQRGRLISILQTSAAQTLAHMVVLWRTPPSLTQQANRRETNSLSATLGACKPAGHPLRTLDEMAEIPGMTPALLHTLAPHLSFTQMDTPSPRTRDPFIHAVFEHLQHQSPGSLSPAQESSIPSPDQDATLSNWAERTLIVTARVKRAGGYRLIRRAIVSSQSGHMTPFAFLSFETTDASQM